jgi:hypothetical protein
MTTTQRLMLMGYLRDIETIAARIERVYGKADQIPSLLRCAAAGVRDAIEEPARESEAAR